MDANYKDGNPLTMKEITGIMVGTLLGGQHTSNVTGTWALCHLLLDKTWMGKVMKEQSDVLGGDLKKDLEYMDVEQLSDFDMVNNSTKIPMTLLPLATVAVLCTSGTLCMHLLHLVPCSLCVSKQGLCPY